MAKETVLISGGAGYIGSHTAVELIAAGYDAVIIDNLSNSEAEAVEGVRRITGVDVPFERVDTCDEAALRRVFEKYDFGSVIHFAAYKAVGESVAEPLKYYRNNLASFMNVCALMKEFGRPNILFSSSATVYGEPDSVPVSEDAPTRPTNPYGHSKLMMEAMMRWVSAAHGIRYVSLRYFNVAGALADGSIGEDHSPESHLIPLVLQVPLGQRPHITIFGEDYATPDGTCIRDYIAVTDLVDAHVKALDHLHRGGDDLICNLGNGQGFSVREIVDCARKVTGHEIPVVMGQRLSLIHISEPTRH